MCRARARTVTASMRAVSTTTCLATANGCRRSTTPTATRPPLPSRTSRIDRRSIHGRYSERVLVLRLQISSEYPGRHKHGLRSVDVCGDLIGRKDQQQTWARFKRIVRCAHDEIGEVLHSG